MINKEAKQKLKTAIIKVNLSLRFYEANWISVQRTPDIEKTRVTNFKDFVEMRFNYEAYKLPELRDAIIRTGGMLFKCESIDGIDEDKRKFKVAHIKLINPEEVIGVEEAQDLDHVTALIHGVEEFIGGNRIRFNSVESRVRVELDDEENL